MWGPIASVMLILVSHALSFGLARLYVGNGSGRPTIVHDMVLIIHRPLRWGTLQVTW